MKNLKPMKNDSTKLEKKITLQQKIINELTEQNELLKQRVDDLQNELDFEREKPNEGYEIAKKLMEQIEMYKLEYERCIAEAKKSKETYDSAREEFYLMKKEYQKKMDTFLKKIQKTI